MTRRLRKSSIHDAPGRQRHRSDRDKRKEENEKKLLPIVGSLLQEFRSVGIAPVPFCLSCLRKETAGGSSCQVLIKQQLPRRFETQAKKWDKNVEKQFEGRYNSTCDMY